MPRDPIKPAGDVSQVHENSVESPPEPTTPHVKQPVPIPKRPATRHTLPRSFYVATRGLLEAAIEQRNLRIHIVIAAIVLVAAWWFRASVRDTVSLLLCIALVLTAELLNTAVEAVVDLLSPEWHEAARRAKDFAAAAVLVSALASAVIGVLIFWPLLFSAS